MNFRTTVILMVLLLVVGSILLFTRDRVTPRESSETADGARIVDIPSSTVTKVSINQTGEKPIVLQRDGVNWRLIEPVQAPAEASAVTQMVDGLINQRAKGQLSADQAKSAGTGLDNPRFRIELVTSDSKTVKMNFGQRSASGDNVYVQREGENGAYLVAGTIVDDLEKPASAFRRMRLFDVSPQQVQQLRITTGDGILELQKVAGKWQIKSPQEMPGDEAEVTDLLLAATGLTATEFVKETVDDPKRRRLDAPQLEVAFSTTQPVTQPVTRPAEMRTVKFGAFSDVNKKSVYAVASDSPALMTIAASSMESLKKKPLELRDRSLVTIDPQQITRIIITRDEFATTQPATRQATHRQIVIERAPTPATLPTSQTTQPATASSHKWQLTVMPDSTTAPASASSAEPADDRLVSGLTALLHPLRVVRYIEPSTVPTSKPANRIQLVVDTTAAGGARASYTLSFAIEDEASGGIPGSIPVVGRGEYNGLAFEPSRALLDSLQSDFTRGSKSGAPDDDAPTFPPSRP